MDKDTLIDTSREGVIAEMEFQCEGRTINWAPERLVIAGYTGKDQASVRKHIQELETLGVPAPKQVPMLYDLSPELLQTSESMRVVRNDSSGEAEVVLLDINGVWYIGLGSDHTDRVLETVSVQKSKQVCAKIISKQLWTLDSIMKHWDEIELKSWVQENGVETVYQSGSLGAFLGPEHLLDLVAKRGYLSSNMALYCGTLPLRRETFHFGGTFKAELFDRKNDRKITFTYETKLLKDAEEEEQYGKTGTGVYGL
ncbi:DUF2848 family protein [Paenibacillus abyssi]|uniref:DUF2848 domain-containing protein n=1 Tax=Paenibacillus abyssi TaxID=1340531 RepID=A0A917FM48_9BACL|nr:DUF2848 family protein [Paenibacillus abyssi]GGF93087.1 hypothetical protein GCM10010916_08050 [Paenibacillus abyssi]